MPVLAIFRQKSASKKMMSHAGPLPGKDIRATRLLMWFVIGTMLFSAKPGPVWSKGVILWDRLKVEPQVAVRETYDDNIYHTNNQTQDDYITTVLAGLDSQFAFTPHMRLDFSYVGAFDWYKNADNFKKDHHYGNLSLKADTAKGSTLEVGAKGEDSAYQPDSPDDRSKDYQLGALYLDLHLSLAASTEFYGNYQHSIRRFDEDIDQRDDYDRDFFALGLVNSRSSLFPLLLEYRYETQDNNQPENATTKFNYQALYTGFKWGQGRRLSGTLRVGYLWSEYNDENAYDGWATDTDLTYTIGAFTSATATAWRGVRESTRSARETLDYYIYAGGELSLTYTRLDPVRLMLYGAYENRDFRSADVTKDRREDDYYAAGVTARYRFNDRFGFSLGYRYRKNDSNVASESYVDNRIMAEIVLFPMADILQLRFPRSPDRILRYF